MGGLDNPLETMTIEHIPKNKQKNKCVCIHTINHYENEDENEK